jgi:hypothetical protein
MFNNKMRKVEENWHWYRGKRGWERKTLVVIDEDGIEETFVHPKDLGVTSRILSLRRSNEVPKARSYRVKAHAQRA